MAVRGERILIRPEHEEGIEAVWPGRLGWSHFPPQAADHTPLSRVIEQKPDPATPAHEPLIYPVQS